MRDSARIDPTIEQIKRYWHANPDLRLGQLICNAASMYSRGVEDGENHDPFYIEDRELIQGLHTWLDARDPA